MATVMTQSVMTPSVITFKHKFEWEVTPHAALEKHSWNVAIDGMEFVDEDGNPVVYFNKDDAWKDVCEFFFDHSVIVKNEEVR